VGGRENRLTGFLEAQRRGKRGYASRVNMSDLSALKMSRAHARVLCHLCHQQRSCYFPDPGEHAVGVLGAEREVNSRTQVRQQHL
jgi:hypothetical protein